MKRTVASAAVAPDTRERRSPPVRNGLVAAPPAAEDAKPRKSIRSVEIGVRVLEALMSSRTGRAPLREIAAAADMSRSQTHRYLLAYVNTGLVSQEANSGLYSFGPTALRIGLSAVSRLDSVQQAAEELRNVVEAIGATGILSIWGDYGPTVVRWIEGAQPMVTSLNIGSVLPLQTSSAGMLFLAFQPPAKIGRLLNRERTNGESLSSAELTRRIAKARKEGFATTDGQVVPGLAAISAPVFDLQGWPAAVMGILGRASDTKFMTDANIAAIRRAAAKASEAIGWRPELGAAINNCSSSDLIKNLPTTPTKKGKRDATARRTPRIGEEM